MGCAQERVGRGRRRVRVKRLDPDRRLEESRKEGKRDN